MNKTPFKRPLQWLLANSATLSSVKFLVVEYVLKYEKIKHFNIVTITVRKT